MDKILLVIAVIAIVIGSALVAPWLLMLIAGALGFNWAFWQVLLGWIALSIIAGLFSRA